MIVGEYTQIKEVSEMSEMKFVATLRDDLYKVCLKHNIPVSPSDVQEIAEELTEIKTSKEEYYNGKN